MKPFAELSRAAQDFLQDAIKIEFDEQGRRIKPELWGVPYFNLDKEPSEEVWQELFRSGWMRSRKHNGKHIEPVRRPCGYMSEECDRLLTAAASKQIARAIGLR